MSNTQKQYIDLFLKGFVGVMVCAVGFFLMKLVNKVDDTHEVVIRLEEKVNRLERDFEPLSKMKR